MQRIARLRDLPPAASRVVIVNCGTRLVTSLALMSAHRHAAAPILVIDCESRDDSARYFAHLARRHSIAFDWLEWPLRSHGATLDALFREVRAETVLLIDSDLELRDRSVCDAMRAALEEEGQAYGSGFLHGPQWLGRANGLPEHVTYYAARMWIPCTLLRTEAIRAALRAGASFRSLRRYYELGRFPRASRLAYLRYRVPGLRALRVPAAVAGRASHAPAIDGRQPVAIDYDTGAALHERLLAEGFRFAALPQALWGDVAHHHGVTRAKRDGAMRRAARSLGLVATGDVSDAAVVAPTVRARLRDAYGVDVAALEGALRG